MLEKIKRIYRFYFRNPPKARVSFKTQVERHGTVYGGWNIIPSSLNKQSVVYSFGIGEDITFDLSVIEKYQCKVHGFDPTPRVIDWLNGQKLPKEFVFHPWALSTTDGVLTFYTPENDAHISHTALPGANSKAVEVPSKCLPTILQLIDHQHIDLLKMDIEGFEYDVLTDMLSKNIRPKQLLIEFHHFNKQIGNAKTEQMIALLEKSGYRLFSIADSFSEYSFVYKG
jgi:FkbM family methyltransferase